MLNDGQPIGHLRPPYIEENEPARQHKKDAIREPRFVDMTRMDVGPESSLLTEGPHATREVRTSRPLYAALPEVHANGNHKTSEDREALQDVDVLAYKPDHSGMLAATLASSHPSSSTTLCAQSMLRATSSALDPVQTLKYIRFKKAEIIPTVIDDFLPSLTLSVTWHSNSADLGNTMKPKHLQHQPTVTLSGNTSSASSGNTAVARDKSMTYVITLTDPDAPSREDPKWSEMCHWIAANLTLSTSVSMLFRASGSDRLDDVVSYKPPGPPKETGKHRYVFLVFAPRNGTTNPLTLIEPKERQHWGTGSERGGVRQWAQQNGLVPVGGNFIYSQHKKQ